MYLLPCPHGHEIPVSPQSAGGTARCPVCGQPQAVPTLGELRRLPRVAEASGGSEKPMAAHMGIRISFAVLMLIALAGAVTATFAGFRWQTIPVPMTTEAHIAMDQEEIATLNPLQLIEVWNQYEQYDLSERQPFGYQRMADMRGHWKRICLIALGVTGLSLLAAIAVAVAGRPHKAVAGRRQRSVGDT